MTATKEQIRQAREWAQKFGHTETGQAAKVLNDILKELYDVAFECASNAADCGYVDDSHCEFCDKDAPDAGQGAECDVNVEHDPHCPWPKLCDVLLKINGGSRK